MGPVILLLEIIMRRLDQKQQLSRHYTLYQMDIYGRD